MQVASGHPPPTYTLTRTQRYHYVSTTKAPRYKSHCDAAFDVEAGDKGRMRRAVRYLTVRGMGCASRQQEGGGGLRSAAQAWCAGPTAGRSPTHSPPSPSPPPHHTHTHALSSTARSPRAPAPGAARCCEPRATSVLRCTGPGPDQQASAMHRQCTGACPHSVGSHPSLPLMHAHTHTYTAAPSTPPAHARHAQPLSVQARLPSASSSSCPPPPLPPA